MAESKRNLNSPHGAERAGPSESGESLWLLTVGPLIWSLHFVLSYVTAAVWYAKVAGRSGPLADARTLIVVFTFVALMGIAYTLWRGWRMMSYGSGRTPHDADSPADRHRFLGFATVLLCGLSFVATAYVALPVVFIGSCA